MGTISNGKPAKDLEGGLCTLGIGKDLASKNGNAGRQTRCNDFFGELIPGTPLCVFVLDWKLRIVHMNPAFERLTGFRKGDVALGRVTLRVHPEDREQTESSIIMALVGRSTRCHCRVRGPDGSFHALDLSFSPLPWEDKCLVLCADAGREPGKGERPADRE